MDLGQPIRTALKESINRNDVTLSASYTKEYDNIVSTHYSETYRNPDFNTLIDDIVRENKNQVKEIIWLCVRSSKELNKIYEDESIINKMIHNKVSQILLQNDNGYYEVTDESTNDAYSLSTFMVTLDTLTRFFLSCYKTPTFVGYLFNNFKDFTLATVNSLHDEHTNVMRFLKDVLLYMLDRMEDEFRNDGRI
jgi:hypothetical protein|nr:MAG TPA: hypothetical protein [Caudoviricetes sp.]